MYIYIYYIIYYILYTIYYILYTIYYILYTIYYILYIIYCILYIIYYILYTIYYILYIIYYILYDISYICIWYMHIYIYMHIYMYIYILLFYMIYDMIWIIWYKLYNIIIFFCWGSKGRHRIPVFTIDCLHSKVPSSRGQALCRWHSWLLLQGLDEQPLIYHRMGKMSGRVWKGGQDDCRTWPWGVRAASNTLSLLHHNPFLLGVWPLAELQRLHMVQNSWHGHAAWWFVVTVCQVTSLSSPWLLWNALLCQWIAVTNCISQRMPVP